MYKWVKELLRVLLKSDEFKKLVLSFIGSNLAKTIGFKGWILGVVIDYGLDKAIIPLVNEMLIAGYTVVDDINGRKTIRKIREASDAENLEDWLNSINDL